jgi:glycosyltransferase involved in cell wall biosynthesis
MKTKVMHIGQLVGGLDRYIRNVVETTGEDYEFVIVHGDHDKAQPVLWEGHELKTYTVTMERKLSLTRDLHALRQIMHIIKEEKPDVIHCHSAKGGFLGRWAGFLTGVRTLYTPHAFSFLSTPNRLARNLYGCFERFGVLNSYLLACSESERQLGMQSVGYSQGHALVWPNAIPDIHIDKISDIEIPDEDYICYMARPSYQKNPFFLIEVMKEVHRRLPTLHFYLLGIGYHSPNIKEMMEGIRSAGLWEWVRVFPWLSHEDFLAYIRKCKLYFTVSRYEGLSLTMLEAMALGKAVVASDVIGNRDCVNDGENGYLLPWDAIQFAERIVNLLQNNDQREAFGKNGRKRFEDNFLIDNQISHLEEIYSGV